MINQRRPTKPGEQQQLPIVGIPLSSEFAIMAGSIGRFWEKFKSDRLIAAAVQLRVLSRL